MNTKQNKNNHTPGPWALGYWSGQCHLDHLHNGDSCVYDYTFKPDETTVSCEKERVEIIGYGEEGPILSPANARLIAAAPDLLVALEAVYEEFGHDISDNNFTLVVNAIDKAKGKTP